MFAKYEVNTESCGLWASGELTANMRTRRSVPGSFWNNSFFPVEFSDTTSPSLLSHLLSPCFLLFSQNLLLLPSLLVSLLRLVLLRHELQLRVRSSRRLCASQCEASYKHQEKLLILYFNFYYNIKQFVCVCAPESLVTRRQHVMMMAADVFIVLVNWPFNLCLGVKNQISLKSTCWITNWVCAAVLAC